MSSLRRTPTAIATLAGQAVAEMTIAVTSISVKATKQDGQKTIVAIIALATSDGDRVADAAVTVRVAFPDGTTQTLTTMSNRRGRATISVPATEEGIYTVAVVAVVKDGWRYAPDANQVDSESIRVR